MDRWLVERINDVVGWWHIDTTAEPLHTYLGWTTAEYGDWLRTGELAPAIAALDAGDVQYWPRAGHCWVCGAMASFIDFTFQAAVCGGICIWAGWEALRLHDTPWKAW